MTDISHIAGLIVGGVYPSPALYADIITTTTHKTLRGPRGAMIMVTKKGLIFDPKLDYKISKSVFPGMQGGPHLNTIAAMGVCLKEANSSSFKKYAKQIILNTKTLALELKKLGYILVGDVESHLILMDLRNMHIDGNTAALALEKAGIIVNKNKIPGDTGSALKPSGIRLGTPFLTSRGMKEKEMKEIAMIINNILKNISNQKVLKSLKTRVLQLSKKF
jgi:glycine hydroxymethyltransferase